MMINTPIKLKRMFAMAISIAMLKVKVFVTIFINELNGFINIENKITVPMLKKRLKCASFLESFSACNIP